MIAQVAIALLGLYLLVGEPLLGRLSYRRMLAALDAGAPAARSRFYLSWVWQGWALLAIALIVTLGVSGWTPAQLGLRLPYWPHRAVVDHAAFSGFVVGVVTAMAVGAAVGLATARKRRHAGSERARESQRESRLAGNRDLILMLPQTRSERCGFAALAVTAGITEEVIWRGFGLTLLFALLPSLHPAVPIALAALAFGWAHLYQGPVGILVTAVLGAVLATLFWASGSLLWPIVTHVLLDLRVLLLRASAHTATEGTP